MNKGAFTHAISTFRRMRFRFRIGKFLIKMCRIAVRFYLGYQKQPWFGPGGSENACVFRMRKWRVTTRLKSQLRYKT